MGKYKCRLYKNNLGSNIDDWIETENNSALQVLSYYVNNGVTKYDTCIIYDKDNKEIDGAGYLYYKGIYRLKKFLKNIN